MNSKRKKGTKRAEVRQRSHLAIGHASRTGSGPQKLHDHVTPALEAAQTLFARGQEDEALRQYQAILKQDQYNIRAYLMMARAYAEQFRMSQAHAVLKWLCQRAPLDAQVHHLAGELFRQIRSPEMALASFESAALLERAMPITLVELASCYERAHRLDDALAVLDRALSHDDNFYEAHLVRARVLRRQRDSSQAVASLERVIQALPASHDLVCQALGELAAIRDAQGDYDGAMQAIENCKRAQLVGSEVHWKNSQQGLLRFSRMLESVTQTDIDQWHEAGAGFQHRRVAVLTGFPRSGTTLLEQVLDAHPQVKCSEECNYFPQRILPELTRGTMPGVSIDRLLNRLSEQQILEQRRRFFEAMESFLGQPLRDRLLLDKNPALMLMVPLELRLLPEMRLLVALRDPRDVVLSCYLRYLPLNVMSVHFLTLERTAKRYALDMQCWLKLRDMVRVPWCELRYEQTVADISLQARRMLETLGLPWDERVLNYRDRLSQKTVSSPSYEAVTEPVYTRAAGRWQHYERYLAPALHILEPYLRAFGYA